jgi:hypothetical protein
VAQKKILNCRIGKGIGITDWKAIDEIWNHTVT